MDKRGSVIASGMGLFVSACLAVFAQPAAAQSAAAAYPAKPVLIVIANVSGGAMGTENRFYTQKLTESLGKPFVLDFKPGAGGVVGASYVAKASPDGYTLLKHPADQDFLILNAMRGLADLTDLLIAAGAVSGLDIKGGMTHVLQQRRSNEIYASA